MRGAGRARSRRTEHSIDAEGTGRARGGWVAHWLALLGASNAIQQSSRKQDSLGPNQLVPACGVGPGFFSTSEISSFRDLEEQQP